MALPRFLYSTSDSEQERLLQTAESGGVFGTPSPKSDLTGALIREVASNPALSPAFVGNLAADSGEEGAQQENRREWEFGGAAVAMELSEPGAGEAGTGKESGSDSDESGMLERMGETRQKSRGGSGERNGAMVGEGQGNKDMVGINADVSTSHSVHTRASQRSSAFLRSLSGACIRNQGEVMAILQSSAELIVIFADLVH